MPVKDTWTGGGVYDTALKNKTALSIELGLVGITGAGGLSNAHICIYLDDTSNGLYGAGNTRFISMDKSTHYVQSDSLTNGMGLPSGPKVVPLERGMYTSDVKWHMMGAQNPKTGTSFPMPTTAKVVVTAEVDGNHGVVGGSLLPLNDLFKALLHSEGKMFSLPIYNSFFKFPYANQNASPLSESDPGEPLLSVQFHAGRNVANEFKAFKRLCDASLFKLSELPTPSQSWVLGYMLPSTTKEIVLANMASGLYAIPITAPPDLIKMPIEEGVNALGKLPGTASLSLSLMHTLLVMSSQ